MCAPQTISLLQGLPETLPQLRRVPLPQGTIGRQCLPLGLLPRSRCPFRIPMTRHIAAGAEGVAGLFTEVTGNLSKISLTA